MTELTVSPVGTGRPGRPVQPAERDCYDLLDRLGIPYRWIDFSRPPETPEEFARIDAPLGVPGMKNLLFSDRKGSILLYVLLPRAKRLNARAFAKSRGLPRLNMASPDALRELLHTSAGLVSLSELQYDTGHRIRVFLDRELLELGQISMLPNVDGTLLGLSAGDVVDRLLPATGHSCEILEPEDPAWAPMEERKESLK